MIFARKRSVMHSKKKPSQARMQVRAVYSSVGLAMKSPSKLANMFPASVRRAVCLALPPTINTRDHFVAGALLVRCVKSQQAKSGPTTIAYVDQREIRRCIKYVVVADRICLKGGGMWVVEHQLLFAQWQRVAPSWRTNNCCSNETLPDRLLRGRKLCPDAFRPPTTNFFGR